MSSRIFIFRAASQTAIVDESRTTVHARVARSVAGGAELSVLLLDG